MVADKELVRECLDLAQAPTILRVKIDQVLDKLFLVFSEGLGEDDKAEFKKLKSSLDYDVLFEKVIDIYAKHHDDEAVTGLIDFYSSSVGRKFLDKQILIMMDIEKVTEEWMNDTMKTLNMN